MNKKNILNGVIGLIILAIMLCPIIIMSTQSNNTEIASESIDEVPLQYAVDNSNTENLDKTAEEIKKEIKSEIDNEQKIVKQNNTKKTATTKKTTTTKKTIKKTTTKKTAAKKVNAPKVSNNAYQNYAHDLVINKYGWSEYDFQCLVKLWNRESGWNPNAHNKKSGAHGIPQSLPASKMKSEGSDYYTNGYTQIRWGLKYIKGRYGSPSKAWAHSQRKGWY